MARRGSSSARANARSAGSSATRSAALSRLLYADDHAVAFAPWASRSPFEIWVVPRQHDADFARATDRDIAAAAEALRHVLGQLASSLDGPPYNLVLHSAPLREQVDATYHWHWEIHPRLREIAGLELGTGLPGQPGLAGGCRGRAPQRSRRRRAAGAPATMTGAGGGGRHTPAGRRRHRGLERRAPDRGEQPILHTGAHVVADPFELEQRRVVPAGRAVSATWDRDEAYQFVEELFAKHQNEIYAYLVRMLRDPELAADLTQDAFVKAYKAYDSLQKPENARAWLYQIAHRVALDDLRRKRIIRFIPLVGESRNTAPSAEHLVMEARLSGDLQRALERIPERQRVGPAPRRAPRHDRPRARGRPRRVARRRPRAAHPGPREPPPGPGRGARRRGRGRAPRDRRREARS